MTNLDSVFKSRDITLPTKVRLVKVMVFPVVMCGCESWTMRKAEHRRIDAFELWCWRRLLRVPWTARRSNKSILKEIGPGCSLEGMMLKLKLQYFGHLMRRVDSLEKNSDAGRDFGQEEKGMTEDEMAGWHHWLDGHESEWTPGVGDGQGGLECCDSWGRKELDTTEWLSWLNWWHVYHCKCHCSLLYITTIYILCEIMLGTFTFDPWMMEGLGILNLCALENKNINYWPPYLQFHNHRLNQPFII